METSWSDSISMEYHAKQWDSPKQSTLELERFLREQVSKSKEIVDLGCGTGAATYFIASRHENCNFLGIDQDNLLIEAAQTTLRTKKKVKNLQFKNGDCFNLSNLKGNSVDGVLSLQTLSWLDSWEEPMKQIYENLKPDWIGISSLFYPGDISAEIRILEPVRERATNYNVISIKELNRHANTYGYEVKIFEEFEISIDLPKPTNEDIMGTYTLKAEKGNVYSRLQVSGPILMPWFFVLVEKISSN
jgi:SAM-dependent methyltransferase